MGKARRGFKCRHRLIDGADRYVKTRDLSTTHMLITALDYKKTKNALTCTMDGNNIQVLAKACGITELQVMYDEECTKENVKAKMQEMGKKVNPGDTFIYYYSGHGTNIKDLSGDEKDGEDEAFCFVTPSGQITYESCMIDDDFSTTICACIDPKAKIVVLTDCCHSGTITDFNSSCWDGRTGVSITGCLDSQTSGDIGRGGIFTHSMLMAIENLMRSGTAEYSVAKLYNATVKEDNRLFKSAQQITIQAPPGCTPQQVLWPLIPIKAYKAPLSKAAEAAAPPLGETKLAENGGAFGEHAAFKPPRVQGYKLHQYFQQNPEEAAKYYIRLSHLHHTAYAASINYLPPYYYRDLEVGGEVSGPPVVTAELREAAGVQSATEMKKMMEFTKQVRPYIQSGTLFQLSKASKVFWLPGYQPPEKAQ